MRHFLAVAMALAITPAGCWAWGEDGHVVVGKIAEANLSPIAKEKISDLLDKRSIGDRRLATWADLIRSSAAYGRKYKNHDKWHYINIEIATKESDFKPDPADDHVIAALERFKKVVVDAAASQDDRKEALLFIVHFVGDLHQPLHCTYRNDDRGGNLQPVKSYAGTAEARLNLHKVWDTHLVRAEMGTLTADDFATRLAGEITPAQKADWEKGEAKAWVWEAHLIGAKNAYVFADGQALPKRELPGVDLTEENYGKVNRPIVREQLKKGGVRLAGLLNEVFSASR